MDNNIKLRTIPQAFKEIQAKDPDTALSVSLLRRLVSSSEIPSVPNGKHPLINISVVEKYISEGGTKNPKPKDLNRDFSQIAEQLNAIHDEHFRNCSEKQSAVTQRPGTQTDIAKITDWG